MTGKPITIRKIQLDTTNAGVDDGLPSSLLREISYLSYLNHPNIVKMIGAEISKNMVQVYFQHCSLNLKDFIKDFDLYVPISLLNTDASHSPSKRTKTLPLWIIKEIIKQICEGLSYIHSNGCFHRNLKPQNILINIDEAQSFGNKGDQEDDQQKSQSLNQVKYINLSNITQEQQQFKFTVKISDFTLSRITTYPSIAYTPQDPKERERSGRQAKRLWYRAPQLLLRKALYSKQIDMWAIGCLFAQIALSQPLFCGDYEIQQLIKIFTLLGGTDQVISLPKTQVKDGVQKTVQVIQNIPQYIRNYNQFQVQMPRWKAVPLHYAASHPKSKEFHTIVKHYIPDREASLRKLIKLADVVGASGLLFFQRCLSLDPDERMTAVQAIKHQFLQSDQNYQPNYSIQLKQRLLTQNNIDKELYINPKYMQTYQVQINNYMRNILIDWLIDVALHFDLQGSTLHLAVSYIDRTLSSILVAKSRLQLVGVACMKIAQAYSERSREYYRQENSKEYAYITADEYSPSDVVAMEKQILMKLKFRINSATIWECLMLIIELAEGCKVNIDIEYLSKVSFFAFLIF